MTRRKRKQEKVMCYREEYAQDVETRKSLMNIIMITINAMGVFEFKYRRNDTFRG